MHGVARAHHGDGDRRLAGLRHGTLVCADLHAALRVAELDPAFVDGDGGFALIDLHQEFGAGDGGVGERGGDLQRARVAADEVRGALEQFEPAGGGLGLRGGDDQGAVLVEADDGFRSEQDGAAAVGAGAQGVTRTEAFVTPNGLPARLPGAFDLQRALHGEGACQLPDRIPVPRPAAAGGGA